MTSFLLSILVTAAALILSFLWAGWQGLVICALLTVMEVSFSFDNAVVNATVMRQLSQVWQRRFLTWGMLITSFGMYYLFPLIIVALATGHGLIEVSRMAIYHQERYSEYVMAAHAQISAFGGMFLLMVFLTFLFDEGKQLHWLGQIEKQLAKLGKLESVEVIAALAVLLALQSFLPADER
ncbi:MAG: DUF475 domain-containing protein, partial [Pseudomonadota bacterium]|nr:DUF475 domain-containing protein [Pseudomonadota bacterium]